MQYLIMLVLLLVSVFLILLILIQRGKGGGLAGAFGGMGGQSAFGAKAGDTFMRITVVVSLIWILLCIVALLYFNAVGPGGSRLEGLGGGEVPTEDAHAEEGGQGEEGETGLSLPGESVGEETGSPTPETTGGGEEAGDTNPASGTEDPGT